MLKDFQRFGEHCTCHLKGFSIACSTNLVPPATPSKKKTSSIHVLAEILLSPHFPIHIVTRTSFVTSFPHSHGHQNFFCHLISPFTWSPKLLLSPLLTTCPLGTYLLIFPKHMLIVLGRSRVQISARRSAILTDVFRGFSQSLQENTGRVPFN
jgi:hypothetical protein